MEHDPAWHAHEHAEAAEHAAHARDPYISRVSITLAVPAVPAAGAGSLETVGTITESSEAVLAQDKATDSWNECQADSLKRHRLTAAAMLVEIGIALSTVAIITRRRTFWFTAMGLGVVGTILFGTAYLA